MRTKSAVAVMLVAVGCGQAVPPMPAAPAPPPADDGVVMEQPAPPPVAESACATLLPKDIGAPVTVTRPRLPLGLYALGATSDGEGNVLLGVGGSMGQDLLSIHGPDGRPRSGAEVLGADLRPMPRGFQGTQVATLEPYTSRIIHLASDGNTTTSPAQAGHLEQVSDPTGGTVVLVLASGELQSYDANAQLRWSQALSLPVVNGKARALGLGVDRAGHTLVVFDGGQDFEEGALAGQWVDAQGNAGATFRIPTARPHVVAAYLIAAPDAGLFLGVAHGISDGSSPWVGRLVPGEEGVHPLPAVFGSRPNAHPFVVRDGRAYALLSTPSEDAPPMSACSLELFDLAGNSCGTLEFATQGRGCRGINLGLDGTVFIRPTLREDECATNGTCIALWTWWPAILR